MKNTVYQKIASQAGLSDQVHKTKGKPIAVTGCGGP
jgi:hypothetical protein